MLDANTGLIIGACGLGVVCFVVIAAMMYVVLQLTGRGYMEFLSLFTPHKDDNEEDNRYMPPARPDLRHIAGRSDFDAAIAKNVVRDELRPTPPTSFPAQSAPPFSSGSPVPSRFPAPGSPPPTTPPPSSNPPPSFRPPSFDDLPPSEPGLPPANPRLRNVNIPNGPYRRRGEMYSDDEIFGGILDEDGDGQIDDYQ